MSLGAVIGEHDNHMLTNFDVTINHARFAWLLEGARGQSHGLEQADNPYPNESESFDWWLFGWMYNHMAMLERN